MESVSASSIAALKSAAQQQLTSASSMKSQAEMRLSTAETAERQATAASPGEGIGAILDKPA